MTAANTWRSCALALSASLLGGDSLHAQNTDPATAAHFVRRMEYGASFDEWNSLVGPNSLLITYALDQIHTGTSMSSLGPETGESKELIKLYHPAFPYETVGTGPDPDPDLNQLPSTLPMQPTALTLDELSEVNIALALSSPNQLREKMTQYWQKHFNTNIFKVSGALAGDQPTLPTPFQYAVHFEWLQNAKFRANALGTFYDLLLASAEGQAMHLYLDSYLSQNDTNDPNDAPNQNYGRELLELHTLGVENWVIDANNQWVKEQPYSFTDILAMARIFSGFYLDDTATSGAAQLEVAFDSNNHFIIDENAPDPNPISVFNNNFFTQFIGAFQYTEIDPKGPTVTTNLGATQALAYLAAHPHTAMNVVSGLWEHFIGGEAPDPSNATMALALAQWGTTGNIKNVMIALLGSPEFANSNRWALARQPMELIGQLHDTFEGKIYDPTPTVDNKAKLSTLREIMQETMGRRLFTYPAPDGFPFESEVQLTSLRFLGANRLRQQLYSEVLAGNGPINYLDFLNLLTAQSVNILDENSIADFMMEMLFANGQGPLDLFSLVDYLQRDSSGAPTTTTLATDFNTNFPEYLARVTSALSFGASYSLNHLK